MISSLLDSAIGCREPFFEPKHEAAFRLFNGFVEGCPDLIVDVYGRTLVMHEYADGEYVDEAQAWLLERFDWVDCVIVKRRNGTAEQRNGTITYGDKPTTKIRENGVRYAVDLTMNRDASFYLDTRHLRTWLTENVAGKSVLNTFAYTGSLGAAAMAGGAARVLQTDLNKRFLNVAKTSYTLNGSPINKRDFRIGDFFAVIKQLNRAKERFDCVLIDPPFFSTTKLGRVDVAEDSIRLVNKVRPLVRHNGRVVIINNGLFVSGRDFYSALETLCAGGYVEIEQLIPVGRDFTGDLTTRVGDLPSDPAPFNHSTKIAVLRIQHKEPTA